MHRDTVAIVHLAKRCNIFDGTLTRIQNVPSHGAISGDLYAQAGPL